jgi:unsaturated rhamnogalacturonyl hydrolase
MTETSALLERVADATAARDMEGNDWTMAVAIEGLAATGEPYVDAARDLTDRAVETQTSAGYLAYGSHDPIPPSVLDPLDGPDYERGQWQCHGAAVGRAVLDCYERTGEERYLDAARRQYGALEDAVEVEGTVSYNSVLPELWVDSLYMVPPFLARYGRLADEPAALEGAVAHVDAQLGRLRDPHTGLFRHVWRATPDSFPESTLWARGNGWALVGILDTLVALPDDHEATERLSTAFAALAAAVRDHQDASGYWRNVLDDPTSPLETSGTLMFAAAFARGVESGLLAGEYLDAAARGFEVCRGVVDERGTVTRVALPPGGPGVRLGDTDYGQGWFLLAADALREAGVLG